VALPIYIVTWRLRQAALTLLIIVITSVVLKFKWYDHLKELEHINGYRGPLNAVREPHTAGKL
jgi:hypothetical protein